jgi:hypothetical protein
LGVGTVLQADFARNSAWWNEEDRDAQDLRILLILEMSIFYQAESFLDFHLEVI